LITQHLTLIATTIAIGGCTLAPPSPQQAFLVAVDAILLAPREQLREVVERSLGVQLDDKGARGFIANTGQAGQLVSGFVRVQVPQPTTRPPGAEVATATVYVSRVRPCITAEEVRVAWRGSRRMADVSDMLIGNETSISELAFVAQSNPFRLARLSFYGRHCFDSFSMIEGEIRETRNQRNIISRSGN